DEDIYVQLEAAAALAAYNDPNAWQFIESKLRSPVMAVPLETQLETIIVASEILQERSQNLLIEVLQDSRRDGELRAGAAWALGRFASPASATALVNTFNSSSVEIKIEAARALLGIAEPQRLHLVELLKNIEPTKRDGISWVLARSGKFDPSEIIAGADDNLRRWISYIIGYGKENFAQAEVEAICHADSEVYFAASVLWQVLASWVYDLKEY
ncbi:HEAT repeat domain-containing protein, partial [Candidatus Oleimmundimicrobium sp.]|uniref:HEAT repeat domain-containing protein n=1 Tax=Candidatus Oleimmundimicrobium sp. TaxID=3060597 RepID=UPI0027244C8C